MPITIIIPTLNEEREIGATLAALQPLRVRGSEVIVVDGESSDGTVAEAASLVDQLIIGPRGRARQMNAGASAAEGDTLLFLHADTRLPADADRLIRESLARTDCAWGRFDVELSGRGLHMRVTGRLISLRSRLTGIATGDQAIFVRRTTFESVGGFPDLPLMEDLELSRKLRRIGRPICLDQRVVTSSRRWEEKGFVRTVLLMWRLRLAYYLGMDVERLARSYR
jgi:rSAM/selenodomain-associated transferase 2